MLGVNICKSNIFTASVYSTPNTIQYLHYTPRANICMSSSYSPFFEIKGNFASHSEITFYTKYGDFIGRLAILMTSLLLLLTITGRLKNI